jgi:hypothetical protein
MSHHGELACACRRAQPLMRSTMAPGPFDPVTPDPLPPEPVSPEPVYNGGGIETGSIIEPVLQSHP